MPQIELPLSEKLLTKARKFSSAANNPKLTDEEAIASASTAIGGMLAQLDPESARREYLRIKNTMLLTADQIAKEKGPVEAAKILLGNAVAAAALEDFSILESDIDQAKLAKLAKSVTVKIKNHFK